MTTKKPKTLKFSDHEKWCNRCESVLSKKEFGICTQNKDGLQYVCSGCRQKIRDSPESKLKKSNYDSIRREDQEVRNASKERVVIWKSKPENQEKRRIEDNFRRHNDVNFQIAQKVRTRIRDALLGNFKSSSSLDLL